MEYEPLPIQTTDEFERDLDILRHQGRDLDELKAVVSALRTHGHVEGYNDHQLSGRWADCRELHLASDWLLVYKIHDGYLKLVRTGSHDSIFP